MRIAVVPCDFDGSGCYRLLFPAAELREQYGWEVAMPPHAQSSMVARDGRFVDDGVLALWFDGLRDRLFAIRPDVVVFQRPVDAGLPGLCAELRAAGIAVVVETDDMLEGAPGWNPSFELLNVRVNARRNTAVFMECVARSDAVSCSTSFLADRYGGTVIRNRLSWPMWEGAPVFEARDWDRVRVGYMGDPRWHSEDLKVLRGLIGPWLERHPEVDFAATFYADQAVSTFDLLEVPEDRRVPLGNVPFRSLELRSVTARFDIGLVPLAVHPFNEGKSHLKGMEYAACGIPCVASPTESYRWWVEPGVNGLLARKPRQWLSALDALLDERVRHRMGAAAYAKAREHTVAEHVGEWADFYSAVVAGKAVAA